MNWAGFERRSGSQPATSGLAPINGHALGLWACLKCAAKNGSRHSLSTTRFFASQSSLAGNPR